MDDKELTDFQREVFAAVREIPSYALSTYGAVARTVGRPGAARAVGSVLAKNPWHYHACHDEDGRRLDDRYVPCHRVVPAGWAESLQTEELPYLGRKDAEAVATRKRLMDAELQCLCVCFFSRSLPPHSSAHPFSYSEP